jgi:hypothetical protein
MVCLSKNGKIQSFKPGPGKRESRASLPALARESGH